MKLEWKIKDEDGDVPADCGQGEFFVDGLLQGGYGYVDCTHTIGGAVAIDPYYYAYTCFGTKTEIPDHGEGTELDQIKEWIMEKSLDEIKHLFQARVYASPQIELQEGKP